MNMTNQELQKKIDAQKRYCKANDLPHFAPFDGYCFSCGRQIYEEITLKKAKTDLITGCPWCHRSFCD